MKEYRNPDGGKGKWVVAMGVADECATPMSPATTPDLTLPLLLCSGKKTHMLCRHCASFSSFWGVHNTLILTSLFRPLISSRFGSRPRRAVVDVRLGLYEAVLVRAQGETWSNRVSVHISSKETPETRGGNVGVRSQETYHMPTRRITRAAVGQCDEV